MNWWHDYHPRILRGNKDFVSNLSKTCQGGHLETEEVEIMTIHLGDAYFANEGETLYRHTVKVSRIIEYKHGGVVEIITRSPTLTDSDWEEFWDATDADDLQMEGDSWREDEHKEDVLRSEIFQRPPLSVVDKRHMAEAQRQSEEPQSGDTSKA